MEEGREGEGVWEEPNYRRRESLVLYKSFNILWRKTVVINADETIETLKNTDIFALSSTNDRCSIWSYPRKRLGRLKMRRLERM
jgi:hypothetical protein